MSDWFFDPLRPLSFELASIDPPWEHETYSEKGWGKSQMAHYEVMKDEEIFALPISQLLSMHSMALLWATAPRLDKAIEALRRWGLTYRSVLVWRKTTVNGKNRMGTGNRVRSSGEIVLVATLGNPEQAWKPRTIFDGIAREHSRKPDEFYAMCERMMPRARKLDLFSRESRPGWTTWGRERTKFDAQQGDDGRPVSSDEAGAARLRCSKPRPVGEGQRDLPLGLPVTP